MMERSANHNPPAEPPVEGSAYVAAQAAMHSLAWLVAANSVGVMLAVLLLVPQFNVLLGEWTYGRWMMVHMNLELYGWTSLPLVGYLLHIYGAERGSMASWSRPVLWLWSTALGLGAISWLSGHTSGKLFLDWSGYARFLFAGALLVLWLFLVLALIAAAKRSERMTALGWSGRFVGLAALLGVPFVLFTASGTGSYPPINPSTGGPTGASQLESSLAIVLIVLMLPLGIAQRKAGSTRVLATAWLLLAAHAVFCALLGRADISHHVPAQYMGLGTILLWLPIVPLYYRAFAWRAEARRWRQAVLWWWSALLVSGVILFLPGVLDHFKFTDGLVGHSFVAMAGFASSLIVLVLVQLLGKDAWIFNRPRAFYAWHGAVAAYVVIMTIAGWLEGFNPAFTIVPGPARNVLYLLRLITGLVMLIASIDWLVDSLKLVGQLASVPETFTLEKTA